jgi:transposase-like protein
MEDMMKKILVVIVAVGLLSSGAGVAWAATGGDSTGGSDPTSAASGALGGRHAGRGALAKLAVQVAADTIHVDRSALVKELRSGKTIADVARDHKVDPQTVIDAIVKAGNEKIDARVAAGKLDPQRAKTAKDRLPQLAGKLVNGKLAHGGRSGHRRAAVRGALDTAATAIHIDRSALVSELRSGKSIADVARDHHVDPQTVIDAIVKAAKDKLTELQSSGKLTAERAQKIEQRLPTAVDKLVNRKFDGSRRRGATAQHAALAA